MDTKIDAILEFTDSNPLIYRKLLNASLSQNGIMPFIGYELISFNYGSREDFLEYLIKENKLEKLRDYLICDDYLESLDRILNQLTQGIFDFRELLEWSLFEDYYSVEMIDWFRALNEPINLIQWFNNGSAITVNFEKMYELLNKTSLTEVVTPANNILLQNHFLREDASVNSVVFKVHGDLFSDKNNLILTKNQFINTYQDEDFLNNLRKWINKYVLLFVGVDVCKDKYIKLILQKTKQEGVNHFALMACDDNLNAKREILHNCAEMGIFPILYNKINPDSIRIILHQLLVDSQNLKWRQSFARGTLHFLYNDQLMIGRDDQLVKLVKFIEDERHFLYCTISSKSITGKSKLALDFAHTYALGWRWYMIPIHDIDDFISTQPSFFKKSSKKQNTLFIFDDYSLYTGSLDDITAFILKIKNYCLKIRLIFISSDIRESNFSRSKSQDSKVMFSPQKSLYEMFVLRLFDIDEIVEISINYVYFRRKELHLTDAEVSDWKKAILDPLRDYVSLIIADDPNEALLFSMVYAVKLTLNYMNATTSDSDTEYVMNEVYNYELTEGTEVGIYTKGVNKKKLNLNRSIRLERIDKQSPKINKNYENINNDMSVSYSMEESFNNLFIGNRPDSRNSHGKAGEGKKWEDLKKT